MLSAKVKGKIYKSVVRNALLERFGKYGVAEFGEMGTGS